VLALSGSPSAVDGVTQTEVRHQCDQGIDEFGQRPLWLRKANCRTPYYRREILEMANSKELAGLIGPVLGVVGASEALNLHIWATNNAPLTYLNGVLLFVAGLAIVRAHNLWTRSWPILITLTGWYVILIGLFRMFAPEVQQGLQNTPAIAVYLINMVMLATGLLLSFKAYWTRA
jgi:hypothetical protein